MAVPAEPAGEERLRSLVLSCDWLMAVLGTVRTTGLPDAWVGAGVVRDVVWGRLYGHGFTPTDVNDVDVAFFDRRDPSRERDSEATRQLRDASPAVPWQARNQAAVHTWYHHKFGGEPVAPLRSIAEAVATWPETATALAVRLGADDEIEICAPLGLDDLLAGVWRRNPRRAGLDVSRARLARHDPASRWPGVRVVAPE